MDKPTLILDWLTALAHPECKDVNAQPAGMQQICLFLISQHALEHMQMDNLHPLTRLVIVDKKKDVITFTPALKRQWDGQVLMGGGRNDEDAVVGLTLPPFEERANVPPFDMQDWKHVCYRASSGRHLSNALDLTARREKAEKS